MKRPLFNLAAAVSLVMMLAVIALWVRSYRMYDALATTTQRFPPCLVESNRGRLHAMVFGRRSPPAPVVHWSYTSPPASEHSPQFAWAYYPDPDNIFRWTVAFPHWFLCLVASLLPMYWLLGAYPRRPLGLCQTCGYDLRATPERCPECGTAAGTAAGKPAAAGESRRA